MKNEQTVTEVQKDLSLEGAIHGDVQADIHGSMIGNIHGDFHGTIYGGVKGKIYGDFHGVLMCENCVQEQKK